MMKSEKAVEGIDADVRQRQQMKSKAKLSWRDAVAKDP